MSWSVYAIGRGPKLLDNVKAQFDKWVKQYQPSNPAEAEQVQDVKTMVVNELSKYKPEQVVKLDSSGVILRVTGRTTVREREGGNVRTGNSDRMSSNVTPDARQVLLRKYRDPSFIDALLNTIEEVVRPSSITVRLKSNGRANSGEGGRDVNQSNLEKDSGRDLYVDNCSVNTTV